MPRQRLRRASNERRLNGAAPSSRCAQGSVADHVGPAWSGHDAAEPLVEDRGRKRAPGVLVVGVAAAEDAPARSLVEAVEREHAAVGQHRQLAAQAVVELAPLEVQRPALTAGQRCALEEQAHTPSAMSLATVRIAWPSGASTADEKFDEPVAIGAGPCQLAPPSPEENT
jgi:hypothetical protein